MVTTHEAYVHLYRVGRVVDRQRGKTVDPEGAPWTITEWEGMTNGGREYIMSLQCALLEGAGRDVNALLANFAMPTDAPETQVVAW